MIHVLHVVPSLDPHSGGPARSVPGLCFAEASVGVRVSLISFGDGESPVPEGVEAIVLPPLFGTRQGLTPSFVKRMRSAVGEAQLVHIHSVWNPPTSIAQTIARSKGVPYVISPRGMLQRVSLKRKAGLKRLAGTLGGKSNVAAASGIHFLTEEEQASSSGFGRLPRRVLVLPNGIEPDLARTVASDAFRARWPSLEDRKLVLFVGRLHWSKGLHTQLDAVTELAKTRSDFLWVLIGPDEGEWVSLSKAGTQRGLGSRITWLGPQPRDVCLQAMRDADVVLMTSRHEAHSMVMNEALGLGTPLIITDSVGFPTIAEAGAALSVHTNPKALASAVQRVLDDEHLSSVMGAAAIRFAEDFLSWPGIARRMVSFYDEILSAGPHLSAS